MSSTNKTEPQNPITQPILDLLEAEQTTLNQTKKQLEDQLRTAQERFDRERLRARTLTSELIDTRREEDRRQLSSDEAVSHALTTQHDEEVTTLQVLLERPYFARVVLEEQDQAGVVRSLEYKIGHSANPLCRIIDWRKAPLSKLYYEYKEGDEYCEEILGRERLGTIVLRNRVEIERGRLQQVTCRHGTYYATQSGWTTTPSRIGSERDFGSLPEILSLITPEQFSAITTDSKATLLIQGVAGSGKTTVALHRLSWILANSEVTAEDCVVITLGPSLREYVKSSLHTLQISSVPVFSYREWCSPQIAPYLPPTLLHGAPKASLLTPTHSRPSPEIEGVKRSMGLFLALEKKSEMIRVDNDPLRLLLATLEDAQLILQNDESKRLTEGLIKAAYLRTRELEERGTLDRSDFSLLLRSLQLTAGALLSSPRSALYKHLVIDEVQDYSPIELATVLSTLTEHGQVTLVGDTTQRTEEGFPGWEKLRKWWGSQRHESSFVRLEVSHRSTKQIVRCAAYLGGVDIPQTGRAGPKPIWMRGHSQELLLQFLLEWLQQLVTGSPTALLGVVCFSTSDVKEVYSLLLPTFGPLVRKGDESDFSFEQGIVVCEAYAAKGLEFEGVLVYNPINSTLPKGEIGRHLLYIASTRAREHLSFATWGKAKTLLESCPDSILERVDLNVVKDEEEQI